MNVGSRAQSEPGRIFNAQPWPKLVKKIGIVLFAKLYRK